MEPCQSVPSQIFIPCSHHFEPSSLTNPAKMFPLLCLAVIKTDDGAGVLVAVFCRQQQQRWQLWPSPRLLFCISSSPSAAPRTHIPPAGSRQDLLAPEVDSFPPGTFRLLAGVLLVLCR